MGEKHSDVASTSTVSVKCETPDSCRIHTPKTESGPIRNVCLAQRGFQGGDGVRGGHSQVGVEAGN